MKLLPILRMTRPRTIPQSAALVLYGAGSAAARGDEGWALLSATMRDVGVGVALTVMTSAIAMLANDYVDYQRGNDTSQTKPHKELVRGHVHPHEVRGVIRVACVVHLACLCCLRGVAARLCVLANAVAALAYTSVLKPIPVLKNAACALIVSMTVGLGALIVCGSQGVVAVAAPMRAVFAVILHREVLMDVVDVDGDRSAGTRTLPALIGARNALIASAVPLLVVAGPAAPVPVLVQTFVVPCLASVPCAVRTAPLLIAYLLARG